MPRSCLRQHRCFSSHLLQVANEVIFLITERALLDLSRLGSESILTQSASAFLPQQHSLGSQSVGAGECPM